MLQVTDLDAFYGRAQVLFHVALEVAAGEVVGLLGRNGAGKSTTLRAIIGLVARRGSILFRDENIAVRETHAIARRGLGYVPEDRRIFAELTVEENLLVGRQPPRPGAPTWTEDRVYALFPSLAGMRRRLGGAMSGGEQQMLAIARTLVGNPLLILLDEPSEGLAPRIVEQMATAILAMRQEGVGVLVSEQNLHFSRAILDRAYVIEKGRIRSESTRADLASGRALLDAHFVQQ